MRYPVGYQKPDRKGRGYWHIKLPGHPLAIDGWVLRHRFVLHSFMASYGEPLTAWCELCGWQDLPWRHELGARRCINVDHINGVKGDDRLENLRPLCFWCNSNRDWAEIEAPDEWCQAIVDMSDTPPWLRPSFIKILGPEWGIGTDDLLVYIRSREYTSQLVA